MSLQTELANLKRSNEENMKQILGAHKVQIDQMNREFTQMESLLKAELWTREAIANILKDKLNKALGEIKALKSYL